MGINHLLNLRFLSRIESEGGQDTQDNGQAPLQDKCRTVLGYVLTLSYVIKRSHDKSKRGEIVLFGFCYGGLRDHPANFELNLCKLTSTVRRTETTTTETTSLRTRQCVLTPTYVPGCCTETGKVPPAHLQLTFPV